MALTYRTLYKNCYYVHSITQPVKWNIGRNYPTRILASGICYKNIYTNKPTIETKEVNLLFKSRRQYSSLGNENINQPPRVPEENKPGLIQRFKQMYRDYWYVLLPVHLATSTVWFGSLYYAVRSGVDVVSLLQSIGVSETLVAPIKDSSAGYFALAFALYKMVTPLRYAVTVGGTTYAIKKLTAVGWIKPVPSRERIKEIIQERKESLQDRFNESKQHYQIQMKEKRSQVMDEMRRYKSEMRNMKNKMKKKCSQVKDEMRKCKPKMRNVKNKVKNM